MTEKYTADQHRNTSGEQGIRRYLRFALPPNVGIALLYEYALIITTRFVLNRLKLDYAALKTNHQQSKQPTLPSADIRHLRVFGQQFFGTIFGTWWYKRIRNEVIKRRNFGETEGTSLKECFKYWKLIRLIHVVWIVSYRLPRQKLLSVSDSEYGNPKCAEFNMAEVNEDCYGRFFQIVQLSVGGVISWVNLRIRNESGEKLRKTQLRAMGYLKHGDITLDTSNKLTSRIVCHFAGCSRKSSWKVLAISEQSEMTQTEFSPLRGLGAKRKKVMPICAFALLSSYDDHNSSWLQTPCINIRIIRHQMTFDQTKPKWAGMQLVIEERKKGPREDTSRCHEMAKPFSIASVSVVYSLSNRYAYFDGIGTWDRSIS
ncbi:hypothetical protein CLF_102872 [Clonorchis sinensis]|uniref:Uncharacterized protein n=1 Tax=Clonorchis sinensis TaxID=79923 RepID=G7Y8P2_CLOSI|nr:hypothetical protein CLF_102872 [Clonorchis sinensis]